MNAPPPLPPIHHLLSVLSTHESVSASDLEQVLRVHRERGGSLADLLLREGILDEEQLFYLLRRRLELPIIADSRLRRLKLPPEAQRRLPRALAREVQAIPVAYEPGKGLLTVAMLDPTDAEAVERIRQSAQVNSVKPLLARRSPLIAMINQIYGEAGEVDVKSPVRPPQARRSGDAGRRSAGKLGAAPPNASHRSSGPGESRREATVQIDPSMEFDLKAMGHPVGMLDAPTKVMKPPMIPLASGGGHPPDSAKEEENTTPPVIGKGRPRRQVVGRSLLKDGQGGANPPTEPPPPPVGEAGPFPPVPESRDPDENTPLRPMPALPRRRRHPPPPAPRGETEELDLDAIEVEVEGEMIEPHDLVPLTPVTGDATPNLTPLPDVEQMEQLDALLSDLLASVGILISMLEERLNISTDMCQEHGQVTRAVAREAGFDELSVSRAVLAAYLYGLDLILRKEVGEEPQLDPFQIFDPAAGAPGGLSAKLRSLGARALGLKENHSAESAPAQVLRLVVRFMVLREESELGAADPDVAAETLLAEGHPSSLVEALVKAMEITAQTLVRGS